MNKSKKNRPKLFTAGALAAGLLSIGTLQAGAAPITVLNPSFELDSPGGFTNGPADWSGDSGSVTANNGASGNYSLNTTSGTQFWITNSNYGQHTISQTTGAYASLGETYTLTVALGEQANSGHTSEDFAGTIALVIGGNIVAENTSATTGTPVKGGFADATLSYTITSDDVGGVVGVELLTSGVRQTVAWDNVRLDVQSAVVPEPSTWALMFTGLVSLIGLGRLRRKA